MTMIHPTVSDRRAIVALCLIAIIACGVLLALDSLREHRTATEQPDTCSFKTSVAVEEVVMKDFDPNTVDSLSLILMGLSERKVKSFLHYRKAGKVFRSVEDVASTYGWSAEDVERLRPFIHFVRSTTSPKRESTKRPSRYEGKGDEKPQSNKFHLLTKVDINAADTAMLIRIPGIGSKTASWIVGYRERLGGFYSPDQLLEIPIVSTDMLEWFSISGHPIVRKLNVNTASFRQLNAHPYITYEQTKALTNYRRLYGDITDIASLRSSGIFADDELQKLMPYIEF